MARCPMCGQHFAEPEDEQGQHDCPRCGHQLPCEECEQALDDEED